MNKGTTATAPLTSQPSPADEVVDRIRTANLDRLTAELPAIVDQTMRKTLPGHYTPEAAAAVSDTILGILTGQLCPVWPTICTDTTPGHYDHFQHQHEVTIKTGHALFGIGFVQNSGGDGPFIYLAGGSESEDYAPSEVREATAKIRRLLDEADEMADKVLRMQAGRRELEARA